MIVTTTLHIFFEAIVPNKTVPKTMSAAMKDGTQFFRNVEGGGWRGITFQDSQSAAFGTARVYYSATIGVVDAMLHRKRQ
ncbi:hypothetical protein Y032_0002g714 [Ancylostoma ceylanicum]|nr:hypothetical protein Y032_0002g714 [Ancylostoma ceylanicum]